MRETLTIKKAAVLGAGVMGAQIAAHLACANVPTMLFDLPGHDDDQNSIAKGAIKSLAKLKPSPLASSTLVEHITPCNYETSLESLKECDLIIEAISERMEYKEQLYKQVIPFISDTAIFSTNTSGLGIGALSEHLPDALKPRFLGVHFFNPPRYMKLVECISHEKTNQNLVNQLEEFLVVRCGKGVVHAKDTPNFIGNRVGVFAMLCALSHAQRLSLAPDLVDALTGTLIGRPKSATYRTMDVVGLDTMKNVVHTTQTALNDDPWNASFGLPDWFEGLIEKGALGQKTRQGVYKKEKEGIMVFDAHENQYRPATLKASQEVIDIFKLPKSEQLAALKASLNPQAQFLWATFRDVFHYCAYHLADIANNVRDVDLAMRWGYGWSTGPFELWQAFGVQSTLELIEQDIAQSESLANCQLPSWVKALPESVFYQGQQAFDPSQGKHVGTKDLACYERQLIKDTIPGTLHHKPTIMFENEGLVVTDLDDTAVVSFKTKRNSISQAVLEGMLEAIDLAERKSQGLILFQGNQQDFSVGANLKDIVSAIKSKQYRQVDHMIRLFHQVALKLKYAQVPTVAAISGLCLGGGCEFSLHVTRRVAALESYMGLPEVGIGLIPAGGGTKEMSLRAYDAQLAVNDFKPLEKIYQLIAKATVSTSALEAKEQWYLKESDVVVMNAYEILFEAQRQVKALTGPSYSPKPASKIQVAGRAAMAQMQSFLVNMREGHFISDHDYRIGSMMAKIVCGGEVDEGTWVDEQWMLDLEREVFMELVESDLTLARIEHTLTTGKPLRN